MNINKYYQLLLFVCIFSAYYNFFLLIFRFDFEKIVRVDEIKKHIQHNAKTNTSNTSISSTSIFMTNLENNHNCVIDIPNKIMVSNIKKNIKSKKNNYYVIIDNKKNICSILADIYEIIIIYATFYITTILLSIITLSVIVEYFIIGQMIKNYNNLTLNNWNKNLTNNVNLTNDITDDKSHDKEENISNDYIHV